MPGRRVSAVQADGAYQLGEAYAPAAWACRSGVLGSAVLLSSLLAACVTAFAGPISFVGIAGLRTGRRGILLLCDLIARSLFAPTELSISSVTAVFGAPVVIWLLVRRHSGEGTV